MLTLLILIPIAILLVLDYFIADEFRHIAQSKGHCGKKYFWWCFFTGFVGYLMVVALPNRPFGTAGEKQKTATVETTRYNGCYC